MTRFCPKCECVKPLNEFYRKNGITNGYCVPCHAEYQKQYRNSKRGNKEYLDARNRNQIKNRQKNMRSRMNTIFHNLRQSSTKRGLSFNICLDQLLVMLFIQNNCCSKTGIPLDFTLGEGVKPFGPTVDRIDGTIGYEPTNIQIVCNIYNYAKNRFSDNDVLEFAKALVIKQG